MSCSKPLPPFTFDVLCYLNRDQLERFSIVCRPLKNLIDRYFYSKPYRVFDKVWVHGGSYALFHNRVQWHPNRDDYSVKQFFAAQESNIGNTLYSFAEMRPYLGPTVRINWTGIGVAGNSIYSPDHIAEMESIAYLWRDRDISIQPVLIKYRTVAEDFHPILNSPTILQCRKLDIHNVQFSFKDYKVLYTVKIIEIFYYGKDGIDLSHWLQFLEEPEVKPIVALMNLDREITNNFVNSLKEAFSSAVSLNAFKIIFVQRNGPLTEFQETNKTTNETLELKKGLPAEYQLHLEHLEHLHLEHLKKYENSTLERSNV